MFCEHGVREPVFVPCAGSDAGLSALWLRRPGGGSFLLIDLSPFNRPGELLFCGQNHGSWPIYGAVLWLVEYSKVQPTVHISVSRPIDLVLRLYSQSIMLWDYLVVLMSLLAGPPVFSWEVFVFSKSVWGWCTAAPGPKYGPVKFNCIIWGLARYHVYLVAPMSQKKIYFH